MQGRPPSGPRLISRRYGSPDRPIIEVGGVLTAATVGQLGTIVRKSLHECPGSIVLDITRLEVTDRVYLTSLITIGHLAAAWPGCRLALCVTEPEVRSAIRNLGIDRYMTLCREPDEGLRRLAALSPVPRLRDHFLPTLNSVEVARTRVHAVCESWGLDGIEEQAQSVVVELVTNSVVHAATPVELTFALTPPFLHIAVRDESPQMPRRRTGEDGAGYGLALVEAFASRWGCHGTPNGKVVWAAIRLPAPQRPGRHAG